MLAERSAYSKSSWQRYLNGNQLVPRKAVVALCAMAGEPPGRLLALWELADQEWSGRARATTPTVKPGEGTGGQTLRAFPRDTLLPTRRRSGTLVGAGGLLSRRPCWGLLLRRHR
ncbi:hypothetical protein [Streptomyces sp. NPDC006333]|uniref:helix-turn-helix domain-containing protein n=1 Tax=Streptomyces sp. NPDC006333 TaxID=3156753 RepID=UPI0033B85E6A